MTYGITDGSKIAGILMSIQKISISLPQQQYDFIENYQTENHYKKTDSEVNPRCSLSSSAKATGSLLSRGNRNRRRF